MQVKLVTDGLGDDYFFLRRELDELEHDGITDIEGTSEAGARGGVVEGIVIALVGSPVLVALVTLVQNWLTRQQSGTVVLEIGGDRVELTGSPTELHQEALAAFLARHPE
ncbi:effector-associated constant component EACC1 [Streptomyces shenzhenensis]